MEAGFAPSSSSSSVRSDQIRSIRSDDDEEEDIANLMRAYVRDLPAEFRPPPWCRRYRSQEELLAVLKRDPLSVAVPDALEFLGRYGVDVVEGAVVRTLVHTASGRIKRPGGLFAKTFTSPKFGPWTQDQVRMYVREEWEEALLRMERSENVTMQRVAREVREKQAGVQRLQRRAG